METLETIDLTAELIQTFRDAQALYSEAEDAPMNQRAQTINSIGTLLKQLAELQKTLLGPSRLQRFEAAAAKVFKAHPELYAQYLKELE